MKKTIIATPQAPGAIGTYSQAVRVGDTVYLSGQIGLDPHTMNLVEGVDGQIEQVLSNLQAVIVASGGTMNDLVRVTVYLTDLNHFSKVNEAMARRLEAPYPARAAVGVAALPKGALVEMDGILVLPA